LESHIIRLPLSQDRWFGKAPDQNDDINHTAFSSKKRLTSAILRDAISFWIALVGRQRMGQKYRPAVDAGPQQRNYSGKISLPSTQITIGSFRHFITSREM